MKVKPDPILNVAGCISSIISPFLKFRVKVLKNYKNFWMQRTTQRIIKLHRLSVAGSLVKEMLEPDVTFSADKETKLIARLVQLQKGNIYWPIFQLAALVLTPYWP